MKKYFIKKSLDQVPYSNLYFEDNAKEHLYLMYGELEVGSTITVLGMISEEAIWLKDGDELEKDDFEIEENWYNKSSKNLEPGDIVEIKPQYNTQDDFDERVHYPQDAFGIISSIEKTDKIYDTWNWEDLITIKKVKQPYYPEEYDDEEDEDFDENKPRKEVVWPYNHIPDTVQERRNVQLKRIKYNIITVKCDKCLTFH